MRTPQVIDFHTHILPGMDDGSRNTQMSIEMLSRMKEQGVDVAVATPHFYGYREEVSRFLERRRASFEKLLCEHQEEHPQIILGAEVAFYSGLSRLEELNSLCIENTNTLLLEMPFSPWTGYEYDVLESLCFDRHLQVVLAHYERFAQLQKNSDFYKRVLRLPVRVQINAESLLPLFKRNQWIDMFRNGQAQLIGSDCHNLSSRAPNLLSARTIIQKRLGASALEKIDEEAVELLMKNMTADSAV